MNSLFDPAGRDEFLARIDRVQPDTKAAWGTMDAAQTMSHCALALETATGDATLTRPLPAKLIGWMFKGSMTSLKPYGKNSPTHPELKVKTPKEFAKEKARLVGVIRKFHDAGPESAGRFEHAFIGRLTGDEWDRCMRKHLDHHLRQFGA